MGCNDQDVAGEPYAAPERVWRKSDLAGRFGWNNPGRFNQEIDILLHEMDDLRRQLTEATQGRRRSDSNCAKFADMYGKALKRAEAAEARIRELEGKK